MNEETKEMIKWIESKLANGEFGNKIKIDNLPKVERLKVKDYFAKDYQVHFTHNTFLVILNTNHEGEE